MVVLQINTFYYFGGSTGKIVNGLRRELINQGEGAYVLYGINRGERIEAGVRKISSDLYKRINGAKAKIKGNHGFNNQLATRRAIRWIDKIKPDIIHLHNLHASYINIELLFRYIKKNNIPVVWTLHDCWPFTGRCAHYEYNNCYKWKEECTDCKFIRKYPESWFFDRSQELFNLKKNIFTSIDNMIIITPSKWLEEQVKGSFLNKYDIRVINNGIDLESFSPKIIDRKSIYRDEKIILAVSYAWTKPKGYDLLIKIAQNLRENSILVVVGAGRKQEKELQKCGIKCVKRLLNNDDLAKWYSLADVFINPTLEDNFPTVNMESIACGTPCVTFDTGGASEIIDHNVGKVVPKGDWKAMINAVYSIEKKELSANCIRRAKELFSCELANQKYYDLYKKILDI